MTSAENNVSQPPNLKIFWARPPYKARVFGTRDIAKKLATTVASPGQKIFQHRIAFPADTNTYPICDSSLYKSPSVADPRGPRSFLYLDQTEARRAERNYLRPSPPPPPPPLYFSCASHATAISFLQQKDLCWYQRCNFMCFAFLLCLPRRIEVPLGIGGVFVSPRNLDRPSQRAHWLGKKMSIW